tara:strand:- start:27801 stop:27917 length:117 start_codon:yes stop_codon:yes gene_type:complete
MNELPSIIMNNGSDIFKISPVNLTFAIRFIIPQKEDES